MSNPEILPRKRRQILILKLLLTQPFIVLGIVLGCCAHPNGRAFGQLCMNLSCLSPFIAFYAVGMFLGLLEYMTRRERIVLTIIGFLGVIAWLGAMFFTAVVDA